MFADRQAEVGLCDRGCSEWFYLGEPGYQELPGRSGWWGGCSSYQHPAGHRALHHALLQSGQWSALWSEWSEWLINVAAGLAPLGPHLLHWQRQVEEAQPWQQGRLETDRVWLADLEAEYFRFPALRGAPSTTPWPSRDLPRWSRCCGQPTVSRRAGVPSYTRTSRFIPRGKSFTRGSTRRWTPTRHSSVGMAGWGNFIYVICII